MTGVNALIQILDEPCFDNSESIPEDTSQSSEHPKGKIDYALESAKHGFKVFPIHGIINGRCTCNEGESCKSPGKHPLHSGWQDEATTDPDRIREMWSEYPHANIGIKTGIESNNVVLDIDPRHGGDESLRELEAEHGKLPDTVESLTGGGGRHIILGHPRGYISNRQNFLLSGIDIRGDGGFIVAPGSIHLSGNTYEWDVMCHPEDVPLADMPSWLIDKLKSPSGGNEAHTPSSEQARELLGKLCDKCKFIRWCKDNQADVSESLWYSGISNVSRISPGGPALCHEISCEYPDYKFKETQDKIFQSLNNSNPHTCEHINQNGYNCSSRCYVKAPIAWLNPVITKELLSEDGDPVPFTKANERCAPFPVDAFPELIRNVIDEYAPYGQQPLPMIATSALSVVSLVTQGHADVARDDYLKGPISLNTNVIAESGERWKH